MKTSEPGSGRSRPEGGDETTTAQESEADNRRAVADEIIISAIAAGASYSEAADLASVSERTVRRRMSEVAFGAEVARHRSERVNVITGRLAQLSEVALDVLEGALDTESVSLRLKAAEMVLSLSRRYLADLDVAARLLAVESAVAGTGTKAGESDD